MALLDRQRILVSSAAGSEDVRRHILVRTALVDEIERHPPYRGLLEAWRDAEIRSAAAKAHIAFKQFAAVSELRVDDVSFAFGGRMVGRLIQPRHALDEPTPPAGRTVPVGAFVDRLLRGETTVTELADLLSMPDHLPPGPIDLDLRSPQPLGTVTWAVEVEQTPRGRARREPLEGLLAEIDEIWGDLGSRRAEALDLLAALGLAAWPALATDVLARYGAAVLGLVRGEKTRWEYAFGDHSVGTAEPLDLDIPAFEATGDAAKDRLRIRRWRERTVQVERAIEAAAIAGTRANPRSRPIRPDDEAAFRRNARWFYQHSADGRPLRAIAAVDLESADRWREVQKALGRTRDLLTIGEDPSQPD